jgi:diguanylate cyclase (GGDEF)-like protein
MYDSPALLTLMSALLVAIMTACAALAMAASSRHCSGRRRHAWLMAAGACVGLGTQAVQLVHPDLPAAVGRLVDAPAPALLGMLFCAIASALALRLATPGPQPKVSVLAAGIGLGLAVLSVHYAALGALRLNAPQQLDGRWTALSLLMALSLCCLTLAVARSQPRRTRDQRLARLLAALLLAAAIVLTDFSAQRSLATPQQLMRPQTPQHIGQDGLSLLLIGCLLALLLAAASFPANARLRQRSNRLHLALDLASEQVSHLQRHDRLTGLPNRTQLREQLELCVQHAQHAPHLLAVYFIDLIAFNQVNALHGHAAGDGVLKRVAHRLQGGMPSPLLLARLGSDEFVVVQQVHDASEAAVLAEQLRSELGEPIHIDGRIIYVGSHVGIALSPEDGASAQLLMTHADAALNHARRQPAPGYSFHAQCRQTKAHEHLHLLPDLQLALSRGQLCLHYQPKFPSCGFPVVGVEALLRWQHPEHGLIAPDSFIPLAERTGLILPIGNWVLDQACRQLQHWRQAGHMDWTMSVNLSPLQFSGPDLVGVVQGALRRHTIPAAQLILEVTETSALGDLHTSLAVLNQLSAMGVRISIDDFGTGYASLLYLKQLPASELKIDRAFVQNLHPGSEDANIIAAIIELGRTLNMRTVAEGVETLEQQQQLQAMGCDLVQGFHLARPLPVSDFEQTYCPARD